MCHNSLSLLDVFANLTPWVQALCVVMCGVVIMGVTLVISRRRQPVEMIHYIAKGDLNSD